MLINGAGGVVGKYAIALAERAGVHVVATASPRSADAVRADAGDEGDVLIDLAPIEPEQFSALVALVRDGGEVVSTTAFIARPNDEARGSAPRRRSCCPTATASASCCPWSTKGRCTSQVTRRIPLAERPALHAEAAAGRISGKVVVLAG